MCKSTLRSSLCHLRCILVITMISVVISGCRQGVVNIERNAQADITPPAITDLVFPTSGSFLPEGSVVITGTAMDPAEEGSGLNQDHPVYLDMEVWGQPVSSTHTTLLQAPARTQRFIVTSTHPEHPDPSFFDWATGHFRIEFGNYRRLKPGRLVFHLYAEDASANVFGPITSNVISGDVPGADLEQLYSARQVYGNKLLTLLNAFTGCLAIYGQEYEDDIAVLNQLRDFVQNTYVTNPVMETWSPDVDTLVAGIHQMEYPDPVVQLGMDEAVDFLHDTIYYGYTYINSYPFYNPVGMSIPEIVQLRQKTVDRYRNDVFSINFQPLTPPAQGVSCHIFLRACDFIQHENSMTDIADFTIIADPTQDLIMTGYIGWVGNRVYLAPDDYEPPIKVLKLIGETAIEGTFTKFW